jgi:hypothetical protein
MAMAEEEAKLKNVQAHSVKEKSWAETKQVSKRGFAAERQ